MSSSGGGLFGRPVTRKGQGRFLFWGKTRNLQRRCNKLDRTGVSPLQGFSHFFPGLAPWAAFLRRFAAIVDLVHSTPIIDLGVP
jgi:hypothetical protein